VKKCSLRKRYNLSRTQIEPFIEDWIFNKRNREIIKKWWFDGVTHEDLAWEYQLSVRQVQNIIYEAEKILTPHLDDIIP
jgi:Mor family transcriptional regulator